MPLGEAPSRLPGGVCGVDGWGQASALLVRGHARRQEADFGSPGKLTDVTAAKPILTKEERRAKREARRAKQREDNVGRAAKMHAARLAWERSAKASAPTAPARTITGNPCRLLGLVLLALARHVLPGRAFHEAVVRPLRPAFQDRRTQCAVLLMAHGRRRPRMVTANWPPEFLLHGEGLRTDHSCQTLLREPRR